MRPDFDRSKSRVVKQKYGVSLQEAQEIIRSSSVQSAGAAVEAIMRNRSVGGLNLGKKLALGVAAMDALVVPIVIAILNAPAIRPQDVADWQTKAGGKMTFDVASIKPSKGAFVPPNIGLNAGEAYRPTGGYFRADFPLWTYIQFAYKISSAEDQSREILAHVPKWVTTDRYSIDARGAGNATKDQMRLMVQ